MKKNFPVENDKNWDRLKTNMYKLCTYMPKVIPASMKYFLKNCQNHDNPRRISMVSI